MVDPVGTRPVTQDRSVGPLVKTSPIAPSRSLVDDRSQTTDATGDATGVVKGIGAVVAELAARAPVDLDRVAKIRRAIETDSYPIIAETIADRLIAIKLNWKPQ